MKNLNKTYSIITVLTVSAWMIGCGEPGDNASQPSTNAVAATEEDHGHEHEETALGNYDIDGVSVEAAQGHGSVEAGKEGHLVIKLPYTDKGATVVRAWIGVEDRTLSMVGKGEYAPSHDDYDIHAVAPDPLMEDAKWWVEIEKPNGETAVGSIPLLKDIANDQ